MTAGMFTFVLTMLRFSYTMNDYVLGPLLFFCNVTCFVKKIIQPIDIARRYNQGKIMQEMTTGMFTFVSTKLYFSQLTIMFYYCKFS